MIELPRALAAWRDALALFPPNVALSIAPLLPRLALAVGPLSVHTRHGTGEPDGYGGITRRGPFERMLTSEWAIALDHPEELTRRMIMGELAFLELARRQPSGSLRSVALFDAGPSQIGAPRIAQLALAIVLARRAREVNATFTWGILQRPDGWVWDELTEASVTGLLEARTAEEATATDVEDWIDRLCSPKAADDLWIVGAPRLRSIAPEPRASRVEVRDVDEPGVRRVHVAVKRRGSPEARVELELPPERAAIRLLRDPFTIEAPPPLRTSTVRALQPGTMPVWSADGRKLFVRASDGSIVVHQPATTPRAPRMEPRWLSTAGETGIAAGIVEREYVVVTTDGESFSVRRYSKRGAPKMIQRVTPPADFQIWVPGESSALEPLWMIPSGVEGGRSIVFRDHAQRLVALTPGHGRRFAHVADGVLAVGGGWRGPVFAVLEGDRSSPFASPFVELRGDVDTTSVAPGHFSGAGALRQAFVSSGHPQDLGNVGLAIARRDSGVWVRLDQTGVAELAIPPGAFVTGIRQFGGEPGALWISADTRALGWSGADTTHTLLSFAEPISGAVHHRIRNDVALVTEDGTIRVVGLTSHVTLFETHTSEGTSDDEVTP